MVRMSKKTAAVLCAVVALLVVSIPVASQIADGDQIAAPSVEGVTRFFFSGGALEGVREAVENAAQTTTSTAFVNVNGATVSWFVPVGDSDLLNVLFTSECRLINSMISSTNQDWVEIRALISRSPLLAGFPTFLQPNDTVSPMALCSANGWAMHAAGWATRVSGGSTGATYTVQVQYRVRNNAPTTNTLGTLSAWVDDWRLKLEAYN
jgi:hypothetical protein